MVRRDDCEQPKENEMSFTLTQEQDVGGAGVVRDFSLNASGQSVGFSEVTAGATYDPVLWSVTGTATVLTDVAGGIGWGSARALNDGGQSVGFELMPNGQSAAVMWSSTRVATLLGTGGGLATPGSVTSAWAINTKGQVVGNVKTPTGGFEAELWFGGNTT